MQPDIPAGLTVEAVERVINDALDEDLGLGGDITTYATVPESERFTGVFMAREAMTVAGLALAGRTFFALSDDVTWTPTVNDGDSIKAGTELARIEGPAHALLAGERVALNLLQHLCGIATMAGVYVKAVAGTGAVILDTRKTLPGLRAVEKYAVACGGAKNHRMRLDDAVLIKDNHIAVAGSVTEAVSRAKKAGLSPIEVECDTLEQVTEAVEAGAEEILLDNMAPEMLKGAVALIDGRAKTEASGGVTLETVRAIAECGVDGVSVGRLTQSAPAVDIGLDWQAG